VIVLSGSSRGLGKAIKNQLEKQGFEVIGLARIENTKENILACDISDYAAIKKTALRIKKLEKPVTALINVAGIASMNLAFTTHQKTTQKIIETNLLGCIYINQLFAPLMMRHKYGTIINFSTIAVKLGLKGESIYVASKAGVEGFSRVFAREVADFGITVNCIAPGPIKTDLLKGIRDDQIKKVTDQQIFTGTMSEQDVFDIVDILLGENARKITGQVFHVGGA